MFQYTRQPACYSTNDANGCFDWTQRTFAVLVLMYYRVTWSVATTLYQVHQCERHKIKAVYGVSDPVYSNEEIVISGIDLGNGLGLALLALISSIIIKLCKAKGHGMKVTTPISKQDVSLLGFAFVGNADLVSGTKDVHTTRITVIKRFRALMTCWNGGI